MSSRERSRRAKELVERRKEEGEEDQFSAPRLERASILHSQTIVQNSKHDLPSSSYIMDEPDRLDSLPFHPQTKPPSLSHDLIAPFALLSSSSPCVSPDRKHILEHARLTLQDSSMNLEVCILNLEDDVAVREVETSGSRSRGRRKKGEVGRLLVLLGGSC